LRPAFEILQRLAYSEEHLLSQVFSLVFANQACQVAKYLGPKGVMQLLKLSFAAAHPIHLLSVE
jgi:hypothetical protein